MEASLAWPWRVAALGGLGPGRARSHAALARLLAAAESAGSGALRALELEAEGGPHPALRLACDRLADGVASGLPLSDALEAQPREFAAWEVGLVRAGERSGRPTDALGAWAAAAERRARLLAVLRSAALYPATLVMVACLVVAVSLWKVVPTLASLYSSVGASIPAPTRWLIRGANAVAALGPWILLLLALLLVLGFVRLRRAARTPAWITLLSGVLPPIGGLSRRASRALALEVVAAATAGGLPPHEALHLAADAQPAALRHGELEAAADSLAAGRGLPAGGRSALLDRRTVRALARALTGADPTAATRALARRAAREQEIAAARAIAVLDLLVALALALLLGFVVVGLALPIFDIPGRVLS